MTQIIIAEVAGELVVDSRIIAEQVEIQHESFMKLIKKHKVKIEAKFGCVGFKIFDIEMPNGGTRQEVEFAWLNESQVTALLTLCRNTERVVDLKFDLVKAFSDQKKQLEKTAQSAIPEASPVLPEISKRNLARKLVDERSAATNIRQDYLWRQAYSELDYLFGYNIGNKKCKGSKIERIEADGQLDNLIAIMQKLWTPNLQIPEPKPPTIRI